MEGARTWDRNNLRGHKTLEGLIWADVDKIPKHPDVDVSDPNPTYHPKNNPLQEGHSPGEVEAVAAHLKRSLEDVVVTIFNAVRTASGSSSAPDASEPLRIRWVEAYFPFTSPSWELEVYWQGDWLEVLGSGIVQQSILSYAGVPDRIGWAFGLGLDRIAMLLYSIPDIRLFWSQDPRFLGQFKEGMPPKKFVPFSKYPACVKDVSFWLPAPTSSTTAPSAAGGLGSPETHTPSHTFHENDVMEIAREVCGDVIEDVKLVDEFVHPKTGRRSCCYRCNYRSLERTLTTEEANEMHEKLKEVLVKRLGVEMR
jgi:phenylalanyl-tRNA synthetase alpha chain